MRIFANHAHVFPRAVREDGTVDALLRVMDDCGIEKAVAFATFPSFLGPGDEEPNRALGARIASEDRLTRLRRDRFYAFRLGGAGGGDRRARVSGYQAASGVPALPRGRRSRLAASMPPLSGSGCF